VSEASSADSAVARLATFLSGLREHEHALLTAERAASARILSLPDAGRALTAADHALSLGEQITRRHLDVLEPPTPIACRAGCHWCCHLKVSVTAPEVFWIAAYLRDKAPPSQLSAALARSAELAKDPRIFSSDAKAEAHIPCALLTDDGACSVHAVRPLTCRGYTSTDAEVCRRMLDDDSELVIMNDALARELAALGLGLLAGIGAAGMASELLELTSALHIALSEPDALPRWLAGEPVFAAALSERGADP
jgi:Putative zinc- or iron-chelating domain